MNFFIAKLTPIAAVFLAPLLLWQGRQTRKNTPRLPGAEGENFGVIQASGESIKLLVLGESTVAGVGARSHAEGLTGQIAQTLREKSGATIHWHALGKIGVTARKVINELVPVLPAEKFDVVVIVLGVNDTLSLRRAKNWVRDLKDLIAILRIHNTTLPIVLAGVPPMQHFPALPRPLRFFLGAKAQSLDNAARQIVSELPALRHVLLTFNGGAEYFCADQFHPSPLGYQVWGEQLAVAVSEQICCVFAEARTE